MNHVLDKIPGHTIEQMGLIIKSMIDDIYREGKGELVESEAVKKSISKRTVQLYKERFLTI